MISLSWLPIGRLLFFYLGAILSLGPADLTPSKIFYFVGLIVLSIISFIQLRHVHIKPIITFLKIRRVAWWILSLLLLNLIISYLNGFSPIEIIRNQIAMLIFVCAFPIYFWCGSKIRPSLLLDIAVIIGIFSAFAFWFIWSQGHGLNSFSSDRIALSSEWVAFLSLAICLNHKTDRNLRSILYFVSVLVICLFMLLSLTRTNILLIIWIAAVSLLTRSGRFYNITKFVAILFLGYLFLKSFMPSLFSNSAFVDRILRSWERFKFGGLGSTGIGADQSVVMRSQQSLMAKNIWKTNLFFGSGQLPKNQIFDTILGSFAKFGIIGAGIFIIAYLKLFRIFQKRSSDKFTFYFPLGSALIPASLIYNWPAERSIWLALGFMLTIYVSREITFESSKSLPSPSRKDI